MRPLESPRLLQRRRHAYRCRKLVQLGVSAVRPTVVSRLSAHRAYRCQKPRLQPINVRKDHGVLG